MFNTRLEEIGVPAFVVFDLMGHSRTTTHDRYRRTTLIHKIEAIAKLDDWLEKEDLLRICYDLRGSKVLPLTASHLVART